MTNPHNYQNGVCTGCGYHGPIDKHHPDGKNPLTKKYINPHNIVLLCPICHTLVGRGMSVANAGRAVNKFWETSGFRRATEALRKQIEDITHQASKRIAHIIRVADIYYVEMEKFEEEMNYWKVVAETNAESNLLGVIDKLTEEKSRLEEEYKRTIEVHNMKAFYNLNHSKLTSKILEGEDDP